MSVVEFFTPPKKTYYWIGQNLETLAKIESSDTISINSVVGAQGISGNQETIIANVDLGADRAITADGEYCNTGDGDSLNKYSGITLYATVSNSQVQTKRTGNHKVTGLNLIKNKPVFIGLNGTLTQTKPNNPFRRIGWAVTHEIIQLDPLPTIES